MCASQASPPSLQDGIFVRGGTLVVLLAPDKVPEGGDEDDGGEDDGGVVHGGGGDSAEGGHAEQRGGKSGPGCRVC